MEKKWLIKRIIILIIIAAFIFGSFKIGSSVKEVTIGCTERYCDCLEGEEISCNSCGVEDIIFASGIVNVYNVCSGEEIVICNDGVRNTRIDVDYNSCQKDTRFFEFSVRVS